MICRQCMVREAREEGKVESAKGPIQYPLGASVQDKLVELRANDASSGCSDRRQANCSDVVLVKATV